MRERKIEGGFVALLVAVGLGAVVVPVHTGVGRGGPKCTDESMRRAWEVLVASLAAHGGPAEIGAAGGLIVELRGTRDQGSTGRGAPRGRWTGCPTGRRGDGCVLLVPEPVPEPVPGWRSG